MDEAQGQVNRAGILATTYARQIGLSPERVYQLVKEGKLTGYRRQEGGRTRLYVAPPEPIVEGDSTAVVPEQMGALLPLAAPDAERRLELLSDYNQRLIAPWERRVEALEAEVAQDREEIGDLKRQVRHLKRELDGMRAALVKALRPETGEGAGS